MLDTIAMLYKSKETRDNIQATVEASRIQRQEWLRQYTNWLWWRSMGEKHENTHTRSTDPKG